MTQSYAQSATARMLEMIKQRQLAEEEKKKIASIEQQVKMAHIPLAVKLPSLPETTDTSQTPVTDITLNDQQQLAVRYAVEGKEFCLIGAAGTGKTTATRKIVEQLAIKLRTELRLSENQSLPTNSIVCVAFTRRAVRNISKALRPIGMHHICKTAHAFLEYEPNYDGYYDKDGVYKKSMRFIPARTERNPVNSCRLIIIDESSMLSYAGLYRELVEAAPNAKFIFIGDLNQLPPVFGDAVLGFKLATLPVVELTQVYRQAMESPIIWFQHNYTLKGAIPPQFMLEKLTAESTPDTGLEFIPFKQNHADGEVMSDGVANYMMRQLEAGLYDPEQDTILIPYNKSFGSIAINLRIAEDLAIRNKLEVYEVVANYRKSYWAVTDFVMFEKQECRIIEISPNPKYLGLQYQLPSIDLSRHGYIRMGGKAPIINLDALNDFVAMDASFLLDQTADSDDAKTLAASHKITIQEVESGTVKTLETAGDINALDFGYCMTIHKSQGSEWRKVWLIIHALHAPMLSRELLYTGMTRARSKLSVLYTGPSATGRTDSTVAKCVKKAVLKGTHWRDKVEVFKGKSEAGGWDEARYRRNRSKGNNWDEAKVGNVEYKCSNCGSYLEKESVSLGGRSECCRAVVNITEVENQCDGDY